MQLLSYSPYDDTGGLGWNLAAAFKACSHHDYRQVCGAPSYLQFPQHDRWDWSNILGWWQTADAVHLHDGFHNTPAQPRPGLVVTYHGTGFREAHAHFLQLSYLKRATVLVATLDLWLLAPDDTTWCPAPFDLDAMAALARMLRDPDPYRPVRIGHSPTNRAIKATDVFLAACDRLAQRHPVDVVLIEGRPWLDCLQAKATCDIWYDQIALGYGGSSIEAWGMGMPVVAGAQDATLVEYERRFGALPFVHADAGSIEPALELLIDPVERARWAAIGNAHAQAWHSQDAAVRLLEPIYEAAAGR